MGSRKDCYVAPSAVVEGDVTLGVGCSVWHGAVLRADLAPIVVGAGTNIQDNAVLHVSRGLPVTLGEGVTVGHGAIVHSCTVGDNSLIGMGAIVLDGTVVGRNCIVGAGALVTKGTVIADGSVAVGSPARVMRPVRDADVAGNRATAQEYVRLACEAGMSYPATQTDQTTQQNEEPPMELRRAQERDIPDIQKLLLQVCQVHADGRPDLFQSGGTKYTAAELVEIIADDSRPIFVAVDDDQRVLGYAFCVVEDYRGDTARTPIRSLYIDDICVDEAARGRHVGMAVYEHVIAYAREQGFYNVTLNVWSCNPGAQRFYEAMGMKPYKVAMEQIL